MKKLAFLILTLSLFSCDSGKSLAEMCKDNPQICQEFAGDSWCKRERVDVALAKIALKTRQQDEQKYHLLLAYEDFVGCMSLASQIQHKKLKEKTTFRKDNLRKAKAQLKKLSEQTVHSNHPYLLFYHWSRELNKESLQKFLKLEGSAELENSISQFNLATYYVKKDINKTLGLLFHALELHNKGEKLNPEILQTLATIFANKKNPKLAYVWLKTYQLALKKPNQNLDLHLRQLIQGYKLNEEFLNKVANNNLDKILNGEFKSPKY